MAAESCLLNTKIKYLLYWYALLMVEKCLNFDGYYRSSYLMLLRRILGRHFVDNLLVI